MIPKITVLSEEITEKEHPSRTYKINFDTTVKAKDTYEIGITENNNLEIVSNDELSAFDLTDNGVLSLSYNMTIDGCELITDSNGTLILTKSTEPISNDQIDGYIDDIEAVTQAVYLILSTERYQFLIYSWDYGIELVDLYGKQMPYVMSELPRRIIEALTQDDRIEDVVDFEFEQNRNKLRVKFTVVSNIGNISTELEVEV